MLEDVEGSNRLHIEHAWQALTRKEVHAYIVFS